MNNRNWSVNGNNNNNHNNNNNIRYTYIAGVLLPPSITVTPVNSQHIKQHTTRAMVPPAAPPPPTAASAAAAAASSAAQLYYQLMADGMSPLTMANLQFQFGPYAPSCFATPPATPISCAGSPITPCHQDDGVDRDLRLALEFVAGEMAARERGVPFLVRGGLTLHDIVEVKAIAKQIATLMARYDAEPRHYTREYLMMMSAFEQLPGDFSHLMLDMHAHISMEELHGIDDVDVYLRGCGPHAVDTLLADAANGDGPPSTASSARGAAPRRARCRSVRNLRPLQCVDTASYYESPRRRRRTKSVYSGRN